MAKLLTANIEQVLKNARLGNKTRANVPNASEILTDSDRARLTAVAAILGIDFAATEYTFNISVKDGQRTIYDVVIANDKNGVPCIFWGKVAQPVTEEIRKRMVIKEVDKKSFIAVELETEDDIETIILPMSLKVLKETQEAGKKYPTKEVATEDQLKLALKKGTLAQYLKERTVFVPAEKLETLEPGIYTVTAYRRNNFGKIEVTLGGHDSPFVLKGNAIRRFDDMPLIDADHPAFLTVGEKEASTYNGNPCWKVPTSIELWADSVEPGNVIKDANGNEIPVFSL